MVSSIAGHNKTKLNFDEVGLCYEAMSKFAGESIVEFTYLEAGGILIRTTNNYIAYRLQADRVYYSSGKGTPPQHFVYKELVSANYLPLLKKRLVRLLKDERWS